MRFYEFNTATIEPSKPETPAQARISSLKTQKDKATQALKAEQERQKKARAQAQLVDAYRIGNGG